MTRIAVTQWRMTLADRYALRDVRRRACNDNDPGHLPTLWSTFQAALLRFRAHGTGARSSTN